MRRWDGSYGKHGTYGTYGKHGKHGIPITPLLPILPILASRSPLAAFPLTAPARRATGYRVKIQVAGEAEPRVQPLEPVDQAFIPGLPTGVLLTVTVAAHNAAGDGAECAPATITLH